MNSIQKLKPLLLSQLRKMRSDQNKLKFFHDNLRNHQIINRPIFPDFSTKFSIQPKDAMFIRMKMNNS